MYNLWSRYGMTINYSCTINFSSHCMYDVSLQCHMGACCFATSSYATAVPHILQLSARPSSQKKMTDPLVTRYKRNSSTSWVFASMDIAWMLWTTFPRRHLWSHSTSHLSDTTMECPGKDWTSMVDWDSMVAWGRSIRWRRSPYKTVSTNIGMSGICLCCTLSSQTLLKWGNRRRKKCFRSEYLFWGLKTRIFFGIENICQAHILQFMRVESAGAFDTTNFQPVEVTAYRSYLSINGTVTVQNEHMLHWAISCCQKSSRFQPS